MPRILVVAPIIHHAVANPRAIRSERLIAGLSRSGFEVMVASYWLGDGAAPVPEGCSRLIAMAGGDPFGPWHGRPSTEDESATPGLDGLGPWSEAVAAELAAFANASRPELLYAIGYPVGALAAGCRIAERIDVPLVIDLGDPWPDHGDKPQSAELELRRQTLNAAAALVTTTPELAAELGADMRPGTARLLAPAGGVIARRPLPRDQVSPATLSPEESPPPLFLHLGTVNPGRAPAHGGFEALGELDAEGRIDFRSHTNAWSAPGEPEIIHKSLPLLDHHAALELGARASCALVLGNRTPAQVPSKAYEISCTETWALCVSAIDPDPTIEVLLEGGHAVVAENPTREAVRAAAEEILKREARGERPTPVEAHSWDHRTDDIAAFIRRLCSRT